MKVILLAAVTADGFIGKTDDHLSTRWTSKEDTKFFIKLSKEIGNLVLGSKTFLTFNQKIKGRKFYVYSRKSEIANEYNNDIEVVNEDPQDLVDRLSDVGMEKLMIAGGSSIYTQFIKAGVVDELYLTVEPIVFGDGIKLFNEEIEVKLDLLEVIDLSDQIRVFHYKVKK